MPFITIKLLEGRTKEQKRSAAQKIAAIAAQELNVPIERVTVFFEDMKPVDYAPKGELVEK